ncbi:mycofactocin biosynthesis glycosyltransferase MftF [Epidermidibacterium keratini]
MRLRADVRRPSPGVLLGGAPLRVLRLRDAALRLFVGDEFVVRDALTDRLAARLLDANVADPVITGPPANARDVTVVIPVRDRPEQLARALAPLSGLRCIVVDDASVDSAAIAEVSAQYGASVVALDCNLGPAGARNAGLAQVTTPYVAFVDSDVVVESDALLRLCRHFVDPRAALVGPLVQARSLSASPRWFERYDATASSLSRGNAGGSVQPGTALGWLPSACLVGRVGVLADFSFAADMHVGEDVDLVWRLIDAGHVVRYDPSESAEHDTRGTVGGWLGRNFAYGTSAADLAARHGGKGAPAVMSVSMAIAAAAVLLRRRWSLPLAAVGAAASGRRILPQLPVVPERWSLTARLVARGLGWAMRQQSGLLLRHWWPLAVVGALTSTSLRRMIFSAVVIDYLVWKAEHRKAPYSPVARRLDDLAYGAGLWRGALRRRSITSLLPRTPR